jgi:NifU-like protein involved in Fe-S cluster formation
MTADDYGQRLKAYREIGYSEKAVIFILCSLNIGRIDKADINCSYQSDCGDTLFIYITLDNLLIVDAKYEYIGCMGLQAAASSLTEMIKGLTLEKSNCITFNDLLSFLESVPASKYECLELALIILKKGIKEFLIKKKMQGQS